MELYILDKNDLSIQSVCKLNSYTINLDEETNSKSNFVFSKCNGMEKGNYIVINGLYKQFLFVIDDDVKSEKNSNIITIPAVDISNMFNRKIIEKNTNMMLDTGIEDFIKKQIEDNFSNTSDNFINMKYIEINVKTHTKTYLQTDSDNYLFNLHTFITNCRKNKDIYMNYKFKNKKIIIDIEKKDDNNIINIDTTLAEVTEYKKVYEIKATTTVICYCQDTKNTYALYLKNDRTTTTNKDDENRADGNIEVISITQEINAYEECLKVIKNNTYNHLVEFKISKNSKLIDVTKLEIGSIIKIKTEEDIYDSYISAINLKDENFVQFKSGRLRIKFLDKIKQMK